MPIAELERLIQSLNEANYTAAISYIRFLSESQDKEPEPDVSRRIGVAKGMFTAPDDLDACNDEVAALFGIA